MVIWPSEVRLDQSAQNAIVAWNGKEEIIILSINIKTLKPVIALEILPLPSNPSTIKEGSFESFEKLVEIMNEKIKKVRQEFFRLGKGAEAPAPGIEITFHEKIGAHDVTVVKVNDLNYFLNWIKDFAIEKGLAVKEISSQFKEGVKNYLKRDIKYFVFDIIDISEGEESIKPLIYKFDSNYLYYPILISGISEISESRAKIRVFFICEEEILDRGYWHPYWQGRFGYPVELNQEELKKISEDIANLFDSKAKVTTFDYYGFLKEFKKDLIFYPRIWKRNLWVGSYGEDVKALQKILINENLWDSDIGATGFFGPITERALIKFQELNKSKILKPYNLEKGTGYFGSKTREVLEESISLVLKEVITWSRNLYLGISGDDVKTLQEILIKENVWPRPDVEATGYFGPITREAVIRFQEKYSEEILKPLGLEKGTGFVGPSTRTFLEKISE
jgi:peptidoglycan hydrolase-like protein with peptidoglycan-binding domain